MSTYLAEFTNGSISKLTKTVVLGPRCVFPRGGPDRIAVHVYNDATMELEFLTWGY
jgi:hypothetical protein